MRHGHSLLLNVLSKVTTPSVAASAETATPGVIVTKLLEHANMMELVRNRTKNGPHLEHRKMLTKVKLGLSMTSYALHQATINTKEIPP